MKSTGTVFQNGNGLYIANKLPPKGNSHRIYFKSETGQQEQGSFKKAIDRSSKVLLKVKTVFPFHFFPTTVIIDESKVTIITQEFYFSESVRSIQIRDIQYVSAEVGFLFGTLRIRAFGFEDMEFYITYLWASLALKARRLIAGLIVCHEENIDYSGYDVDSLSKFIELIGEEHR